MPVIKNDALYVPHDKRYHCEIQYEGELGMFFTSAIGDTLEELADDVRYELRKVKNRLPQIVHVEDIHNNNVFTEVFIEDYKKGAYNVR